MSFLLFFWIFRGKIVLGYTEAELRVRGSGYQFIHAADMLYCAENHVRSKSRLFRLFRVTGMKIQVGRDRQGNTNLCQAAVEQGS